MQTIEQLQDAYAEAERQSELWCRLAGEAMDALDSLSCWSDRQDQAAEAAGNMADFAEKAASDIRAAHALLYKGPIRPAEIMPAPETPIQLHGGQIQPAMFFYTIEGQNLYHIAIEHGFDCQFGDLFDQGLTDEENEDALASYERTPDATLSAWVPEVPDGWQFAGKWHGEDGPVSCFLRKKEIAA
ncbi:hypothetical protein ASG47_19605 [Devosia sp. Leaf420]|uniref:hypothetical protein n=1 Tax=Devosia sp. Leaf420 TaxID=1736374 RepID=UPI000712BE46|nr:hypothetical protein [Devosia sp. Leaf420]KQT50312.1 hypothetical protein ASG47_19605 [Devosia sp. Leaf420]